MTAWILPTIALLADIVAADVEKGIARFANGASKADQHAYCENEVFNATCETGHVVVMTRAHYGRMKLCRCVILDYGHIGCGADVLELSDTRCSGKRQCEIRIPDALFAKMKPCPDDLKPYLEAEYRCVKVETAAETCIGHQPILRQSSHGAIANLITEATGCGGLRNPWLIQVEQGQSISVTLLDFNVNNFKLGFAKPTCQVYAQIRERLHRGARNVTVCGGNNRQRAVYTSTTNRIEIAIISSNNGDTIPYFLLNYEAVGCPDLAPQPHSHVVREGNLLTVKCNHTRDVFHLRCSANRWHGPLGNCSEGISYTVEHTEPNGDNIPYGMSILIVLAIALTIGLFVLLVGLVFLRRQRGLCMARQPDMNSCPPRIEADDKEYVSAMWIRNRDSPNGTSKWRDTDTYSTYAPSELPPCTPLMERGARPPVYGQLQQQKLPCGCSTYVDTGEISEYVTRQQLLNAQGGRPEKLILRPGEPTQYFIVEADRPPPPPNKGSRPNVVMQTDDLKMRLRVNDAGEKVVEHQPLMEALPPEASVAMVPQEQQGPPPDVSYSAICKERLDNEANDEVRPRCAHLR